MEQAISIKNLTKHYKGFTLDNVSFDVPKGSIMGFIGENGAGKTTTIKAILNLINRDSGSIEIFGKDNIAFEKQLKQDIGVVLDDSFFYQDIRPVDIPLILKNLYKNFDSSLYESYITKFSLPNKKTIKEFSTGMKMKLSIACALSHNPKLLVLDEPTSGLDPIVRSEILDIFLDFIQDEEHTIFLSSHITSDLEKISDYITFIHEGKIVFSERKDTLLDDYAVIKCGADDFNKIDAADIAAYRKSQFSCEVLVKNKDKAKIKYRDFVIDNTSLEEIMLFMIRGDR